MRKFVEIGGQSILRLLGAQLGQPGEGGFLSRLSGVLSEMADKAGSLGLGSVFTDQGTQGELAVAAISPDYHRAAVSSYHMDPRANGLRISDLRGGS